MTDKPIKKQTRRKLLPSEIDEMKKLYKEGRTINSIAQEFRINWNSCNYHLNESYKKQTLSKNKSYRESNREKIAELDGEHYQNNKEHYKKYNQWYHQENSDAIKIQIKNYRSQPDIVQRENKRKRDEIPKKKLELLEKIASLNHRTIQCFGFPSFGSCGLNDTSETRIERLVFDHINGGGSKDRSNIGSLQWLRNQLKLHNDELICKLQILCASCNHTKEMNARSI